MNTETQLARMIRVTKDKARYDSQVKKLLANRAILAWILKTCTEEFAPYSPREIEDCILGEPVISRQPVYPDEPAGEESYLDGDAILTGENTEDNTIREGTIYYDIRLDACAPGKNQPIELIINIEAQLDPSPGYPIEKRSVYYCSRLISGQYGTVFSHGEYRKIRKVYSIWFCLDPPKKRRNTIKKITLGETAVYGEPDTSGKDSDLMEAVIVNLGEGQKYVDNPILRLMNVLLAGEVDIQKKQRVMEKEFHIAMTREMKTEVENLCNLSEGIYNKGYRIGVEQGIELGIEGAVDILREAGFEDCQIIERIRKRYDLTMEEAEKYVLARV